MAAKNVLIVGNLGYVGPVVEQHLKKSHEDIFIAGYDIGYFSGPSTWTGPAGATSIDRQHQGDVRAFDAELLNGIDAVVYLAAISNDPMGNVYETPTLDINYHAAVAIARMARDRGVTSFVFASSCSVYGFADSAPRTERSEVNPLTAYAKSKVFSERELEPLASSDFTITCLRFATACGFSDRLRLDLVLNDFVASAIVNKSITILSDGTPWRPLIHVKDMALAIDWAIQRHTAPGFLVVNTGSDEWNYQVKDLAYAVQKQFGDVTIDINQNAPPDNRSYKVDFGLYKTLAPDFQPRISLSGAIEDLRQGLERIDFSDRNFRSSSLIRLKIIQHLVERSILNSKLEIITATTAS